MQRNATVLGLSGALMWMFSWGCSTEEGGEGQACYANATCDAGLSCLSDVCVDANGDDGGAESGDGDAPVIDLEECFSCADAECPDERSACDAAEGCSDVLRCSIQCDSTGPCDCDVSGLAAEGISAVTSYITCSATACASECTPSISDGGDGDLPGDGSGGGTGKRRNIDVWKRR